MIGKRVFLPNKTPFAQALLTVMERTLRGQVFRAKGAVVA